MLRLSEAIRLGAISCKWGQGQFVSKDGSRCALGMAAFAVGRLDVVITDRVVELWPWTKERLRYEIPETEMRTIWKVIVNLNDRGKKTPLQIADWVEGLERERGMWDGEEVKGEVNQEVVSIHN